MWQPNNSVTEKFALISDFRGEAASYKIIFYGKNFYKTPLEFLDKNYSL